MDKARRQAIHDAMVRLSDGDRTAFDVLLDELWPVIVSFAERGVGRGADAEDVAQEVFYRICARITDFDRARDGLSWAFGIASYEIMTHRRRLKRRREVFDEISLFEQIDSTASQDDRLISQEMTAALERAASTLTEAERAALGLQSSVSDAASAAHRKRKQRALDRLRRVWRQIYGEP